MIQIDFNPCHYPYRSALPHSSTTELTFRAGSNPALGVSTVCNGKNLRQ